MGACETSVRKGGNQEKRKICSVNFKIVCPTFFVIEVCCGIITI